MQGDSATKAVGYKIVRFIQRSIQVHQVVYLQVTTPPERCPVKPCLDLEHDKMMPATRFA